MTLTIKEHESTKYAPRTWTNAKRGDVTAAFALNFTTPGEVLTQRAAGDRYTSCLLSCDPRLAAELTNCFRLTRHPNKTLNIAGNGMFTLARYIWTQARVNQWVYDVLKTMHERVPIAGIYTGGQTGVDLAGAVGAVALNIPCLVTLPQGFLQRGSDGIDRQHTQKEIEAQIADGVSKLC